EVGVESTIVSVEGRRVTLLRPGGTAPEDILSVTGYLDRIKNDGEAINAPGQLKTHYAPHTPLVIVEEDDMIPEGGNRALLSFRKKIPDGFFAGEVLSPSGDLQEAAASLFSALHRLDRCGADIIYAHSVPSGGLGEAIMNRMEKAAAARNSN
ncbi:MAG: Sua5 family C-terminal domain-containing protein, partial [Spirochaetota bacterium]